MLPDIGLLLAVYALTQALAIPKTAPIPARFAAAISIPVILLLAADILLQGLPK